MELQRKIICSTMVVALGGLILYSILYFKDVGVDANSIIIWASQIALAICTSSLVTGMVAIVSFIKMKNEYYEFLAKDLSRLYDIVDDYLVIQKDVDIYFDEYYSFRNDFLNYVMACERETVSLSKKEYAVVSETLYKLYIIPRGMLYYSYRAVKKLENQYNQEKKSGRVIKKYRKKLDKELLELNMYLYNLKEENLYNKQAMFFLSNIGLKDEEKHNIDDVDSRYKQEFYQSNND